MADMTSIEWCDSTFNPWIGCTKVSTSKTCGGGCDGCYAEHSTPARVLRSRGIETWGPGAPRHRTSPSTWSKPLLWEREHAAFFAEHGRRRRVFCASLADVFDNEVDPAWRADLFWLIHQTPNLDWLLLTKRIGNAAAMMHEAAVTIDPTGEWPLPWPNVWLGATVVNQAEADRDIPKLLEVPARVRFLSIEPMLGPVKLYGRDDGGTLWIGGQRGCGGTHRHSGDPAGHDHGRGTGWASGDPRIEHHHHDHRCNRGIDWVICGGESGPNARPMHPDWVRSLRDQCAAAGVPFLFKQWGEWTPGENVERVRGTVDTAFLYDDGWHTYPLNLATDHGHIDDQPDLYRVGKKAAGRLLDGVEHNGFPEVTP